ncbi:hypothetical protein ACROYT_G026312 [Oculina patagonica]
MLKTAGRLPAFCLRRIKRIFWPNKISNKDLLSSSNLEPVSIVVQKRRWRWLGHVLRMRADSVPRVALRWTPQGKRSRGRPKETWRRTVQKDLLERGLTMEAARQQAEDRQMWQMSSSLLPPAHQTHLLAKQDQQQRPIESVAEVGLRRPGGEQCRKTCWSVASQWKQQDSRQRTGKCGKCLPAFCLRRIKRIFWPNKISNKDLLSSSNLEPVSIVVQKRRWRWLGHVLRMRADSVPRVALRWTPQGKRSRGRPKETWRRTVQKDLLERGLTMEAARQQAEDWQMWRSLTEAPRATRHSGS